MGGFAFIIQLCSFAITQVSDELNKTGDMAAYLDDEMVAAAETDTIWHRNTLCLLFDLIGVYTNDCPENIRDIQSQYGKYMCIYECM